MPTRYLKPGICDSEAIDNCSAMAETLFYRLLVNVDDFGRIDARHAVIRARCFPLKNISKEQVKKLLFELHENGLIILYRSNDCDYLQMNKWDNKPRSNESKCPEPTDECIQTYTNVNHLHTNLPVTVTETVTKTVTKTRSLVSEQFSIFWKEYPNKKAKPKALEAWRKNKPNLQEVLKALAWQKETEQWQKNGGEFIPYPATWLNAGRWQDEPPEKINGVAKPKEPDWRESKEGIERVGKEIELEQLPNEDIKSYRKRIQEKLDEIRTH